MSDWYDDSYFSGTDWDGNGIDWYDYEFDREVYRSGSGSGRGPRKRKNMTDGQFIVLLLVIFLIILGICIPAVGAFLLIGAWLAGFSALIKMVFH